MEDHDNMNAHGTGIMFGYEWVPVEIKTPRALRRGCRHRLISGLGVSRVHDPKRRIFQRVLIKKICDAYHYSFFAEARFIHNDELRNDTYGTWDDAESSNDL